MTQTSNIQWREIKCILEKEESSENKINEDAKPEDKAEDKAKDDIKPEEKTASAELSEKSSNPSGE